MIVYSEGKGIDSLFPWPDLFPWPVWASSLAIIHSLFIRVMAYLHRPTVMLLCSTARFGFFCARDCRKTIDQVVE
jgi:hypothetical protein